MTVIRFPSNTAVASLAALALIAVAAPPAFADHAHKRNGIYHGLGDSERGEEADGIVHPFTGADRPRRLSLHLFEDWAQIGGGSCRLCRHRHLEYDTGAGSGECHTFSHHNGRGIPGHTHAHHFFNLGGGGCVDPADLGQEVTYSGDVYAEPVGTSTPTLVESAQTPSGVSYDVYLFDSDQGLCFEIRIAGNADGACGLDLHQGIEFNALSSVTESGGETVVVGPVSTEIARVNVTGISDRGHVVDASEVTPESLSGRGFNFFAASVRVPASDGVLTLNASNWASGGPIVDSWTDASAARAVEDPHTVLEGWNVKDRDQQNRAADAFHTAEAGEHEAEQLGGAVDGVEGEDTFEGSCYADGVVAPDQQQKFELSLYGECSGELNGTSVQDEDITITAKGRGLMTCGGTTESLSGAVWSGPVSDPWNPSWYSEGAEAALTFPYQPSLVDGTADTRIDTEFEFQTQSGFLSQWGFGAVHVAGEEGGDALGLAFAGWCYEGSDGTQVFDFFFQDLETTTALRG